MVLLSATIITVFVPDYDHLNKVKTRKNPLGEIEKCERDSAGRLLRKTSPSGKAITYD